MPVDFPTGCRLSIEENPSWQAREFIDERLGDYNAPFLADHRYDYFGIFLRSDAGDIQAGLIGHLYAGWLFINLLWVHSELRRAGIGSRLVAEAERRAIAFGCHSSYVDTFSFQVRIFIRNSATKCSEPWIIPLTTNEFSCGSS
jgi:GNAT superfamily N-acetyltransferase